MQLRHTVLPFTAALLAAACANDNPGSRTAVHRDSAGIDIVENRLTDDLAGWSLSAGPRLAFGTAEGEEPLQFFGISGLHRFDDGRIAVVNAGSREVRIFDAAGTFLRSFGKQGNGPEEFQLPVLAGVLADTLIVVDNQAGHRLSFVHPDAGFIRIVRVADDVGGYLNPVGALDGGRPVFGGALDMSKTRLKAGFNRASTFYRAASPDGSLAADFGDVDGAEFWIEEISAEGRPSPPVLIPFGRTGQAAAGADRFYFSDQSTFEIRAFDPDGAVVRIIRLEQEPVAVTEQDRQRYIDATLANVPDAEQADILRRQLNNTPLPDAFPSLAAMLADRAGNLWVAGYDRPGETRNAWLVFDHEGELAARITLPPGFDPLEIGKDYALGVFRDELGVETVRLYALDRKGTP